MMQIPFASVPVCLYGSYMQTAKEEFAWAVGLFEGEGNIFRKDETRSFVMSLKMNDEDVVRRFHAAVGIGRVKPRKPNKGASVPQVWEWLNTRTLDIIALAQKFLPHMGVRRAAQIEAALKDKRLKIRPRRSDLSPPVADCGHMTRGEVSNRGSKRHLSRGETPCHVCAANCRAYYRQWKANR